MSKQREEQLYTMENLKKQHRELLLFTVDNLARSVGIRDMYTGEHSRRVAVFAILLGEQLRISAEDLERLRFGSLLHDIGKIGIDDDILRKPDRLTSAEFNIMKTHTTKGAEIVTMVPDLALVVPIVRSHHERWDGGGYPDGLKGENIPWLARIVAVANAFDAMAFDTPFRRGQAAEFAFAEIERHQGQQFDPKVVAAFLQIHEKVVETMRGLEQKRNGQVVVAE